MSGERKRRSSGEAGLRARLGRVVGARGGEEEGEKVGKRRRK